jgi:hypothetical protein
MSTFVKNIFLIAGTMMLSLLIFSVVFGSIGKSFMWHSMEPVFQKGWNKYTMNDGDMLTDNLTKVFDNAKELKH